MRRMAVWGLILGVAVIAAILVSRAVGPAPAVLPQGVKAYAGERSFTPEEFAAFKKFVGGRDVELRHIEVSNSTVPPSVQFEVMVTDGVVCPYGDAVEANPVNIKAVVVGIGVFAVIVVAGVWVVNIPRIGGARWGRH